MLKEQGEIREIIQQFYFWARENPTRGRTINLEKLSETVTDQIHTLYMKWFKALLDQLTVIDESACVKEFDRASFRQDEKGEYNRLRQAKQAIANLQLQQDKQTLLDLMGE